MEETVTMINEIHNLIILEIILFLVTSLETQFCSVVCVMLIKWKPQTSAPLITIKLG